jgi:hypothetical protein
MIAFREEEEEEEEEKVFNRCVPVAIGYRRYTRSV